MLFLRSIDWNGAFYNVNCVIRTILQKNYRKMNISWSFFYNSLQNYMVKKFWTHYMTVLYPNPCRNKVCYKGNTGILYLCSFYYVYLMYNNL